MAGGIKTGASLDTAEVARMPRDRTRGQRATTLRVPLDSTYVFDRDTSGAPIATHGLDFAASGAPRVALEAYDNVTIFRQPDFEYPRAVNIQGQVRYPGRYSLRTRT